MKKSVGIVLLAILLVFSLIGCGDDESPSVASSSAVASSSSGISSIGTSSSAVASSSSVVSSSSAGPVAVIFTGLSANGTSGSVTTTELTLTFSVNPVGLLASHITLTGATKGALSGSGTSRTLVISGITVANGANVTVALANPVGFAITPASKTVAVNICPLDSVTYRDMANVLGGTFTQTITSGGGSFSHTLTGFKMARYQVTYELWHTVYTWATNHGYLFALAGREGNGGIDGSAPTSAKYEPVTMINWRDAMVWCNAYSQLDGKVPVYCSDSSFLTPIKVSHDGSYGASINTNAGSFDNPYVNWGATG